MLCIISVLFLCIGAIWSVHAAIEKIGQELKKTNQLLREIAKQNDVVLPEGETAITKSERK